MEGRLQVNYKDKTNETECRQRHRLFWLNSSAGVPLVYAAAKNRHFTPVPWVSSLPRKSWDLLPDWHLNQIGNFLEGTLFLGDAMPVASLMVGLDITNTAVLAGGDYDYSSTGECIAFKPGSFDLFRPIRKFSKNHPLAEALKRCYQDVFSVVGNRACVNTPMTLDALSSLYGIRGSTALLLDLIKHKEHVRQRVREMTASYLAFYDYFYEYLKEHGYGESAS